MQITPVDGENNLFRVEDAVSDDLLQKVLSTPWANLPWARQQYQEHWSRRRINDDSIPWIEQWHDTMRFTVWPKVEHALQMKLDWYPGTAWWFDEPGFTCGIHTDGELPGSLQLTWIGADTLGTVFYWYKNPNTLRFQTPFKPNSGYIMRNLPDETGYRKLQWHGMLTPVPANSFRLTSYTVITPTI